MNCNEQNKNTIIEGKQRERTLVRTANSRMKGNGLGTTILFASHDSHGSLARSLSRPVAITVTER